jgi:GH25 family lysozyme M1 (1,4-beta-N-acetylmuramidase)
MDFNPNTRTEEFFALPVSRFSRFYRTLTTPSGDTLRGLDFSHWQKDENIDFVMLKDNDIDFVILKVTEGTGFIDNTFKSKFEAALAAGLIVMPYHFFRGNYGGAAQAKHCIDTLIELGFFAAIEYVPIIWADVETSDGVSITTRRNRLLAFLQTIESNGYQGGVYSSPYYWNSLIGYVAWIANYWQWDAHWADINYPTLPTGWSKEKCIVWQNGIHPAHYWVEEVIGATGNVDHNYFFGTIERLKEILKFPVTPPPADCCDEVKEMIEQIQADITYLRESDEFIKERLDSIEQGQEALFYKTDELEGRIVALEKFEETLRRALCGE